MTRLTNNVRNQVLLGALACGSFLGLGSAMGQQQKMAATAAKTPQIAYVFPNGGQRGARAEIEVKGKNLGTVTDLYFSQPVGTVEKLEAKSADRLLATIAIHNETPTGIIELRAISADGMSNLRLFRVDEFPEVNETSGKNDTPAQAQLIDHPAVVNGQLSNADIDCYRIQVMEKKRLVFEVEARRLGSPVEARVRLLDSDGRLLADASTTRATRPDERLDFEFHEPGDYIVAVEDAQYAGGDGAVYRLRVGSWLYATSMYPLGGRRGETVAVTLNGGNLADAVTVDVPLPQGIGPFKPQFSGAHTTLQAPMLMAAGDEPETAEKEPNEALASAQAIEWPCTVNGRIDAPNDTDHYVIRAKKGEKIAVEVFADRLGSWLDSVLTVTDRNGKLVVENDDLRQGNVQQNAQNRTGITPISDSRAEFTAPADGEYVVAVDDRFYSGGPQFAYRLEVSRSLPDFSLAFGAPPAARNQAQAKNQPAPIGDVINLEPGKSIPLLVAVSRRGYDGEITLAVEGLPEGVTFEQGKIAAKQAAGQVTIKAGSEAATHIGRARVIGTAQINNLPVTRVVQNEIIVAQIDALHTARVELSDLAIAVLRREAPLSLRVDGDAVLARGLETEIKVAIDRRAGFKGPVEIKVDKLPKGVTAEAIQIGEDETEGTLKLGSAANSAVSKQKIRIVSVGKFGAASIEASAEIALAVVMPFELTLNPEESELELTAGEFCSLKIGVKRLGNFDGPIEIAVSGLPEGVSVSPETIEPDEDEIELNFAVSSETKPAKSKKQLKISATGEIGKQKVKFETAAIAVSVKEPNP